MHARRPSVRHPPWRSPRQTTRCHVARPRMQIHPESTGDLQQQQQQQHLSHKQVRSAKCALHSSPHLHAHMHMSALPARTSAVPLACVHWRHRRPHLLGREGLLPSAQHRIGNRRPYLHKGWRLGVVGQGGRWCATQGRI